MFSEGEVYLVISNNYGNNYIKFRGIRRILFSFIVILKLIKLIIFKKSISVCWEKLSLIIYLVLGSLGF